MIAIEEQTLGAPREGLDNAEKSMPLAIEWPDQAQFSFSLRPTVVKALDGPERTPDITEAGRTHPREESSDDRTRQNNLPRRVA